MTTGSTTPTPNTPAKRRTSRRRGVPEARPAATKPAAWDTGYRSAQRVWPD
jgi:hypothetical protein